jgi:NADH-quinone oxidoreductase subunit J
MLTNKVIDVEMKTGTLQIVPASVVVALTAGTLCGIFYITDWKIVQSVVPLKTTTYSLGEMFMTTYLLPFEAVSIVLLVALVGAAFIARKEKSIRALE